MGFGQKMINRSPYSYSSNMGLLEGSMSVCLKKIGIARIRRQIQVNIQSQCGNSERAYTPQ